MTLCVFKLTCLFNRDATRSITQYVRDIAYVHSKLVLHEVGQSEYPCAGVCVDNGVSGVSPVAEQFRVTLSPGTTGSIVVIVTSGMTTDKMCNYLRV